MHNVQRQLYLEQASVDKGLRAIWVEARPCRNDMVFRGPDRAFRAIGLFLVRGHDVLCEVEIDRELSDLRARLVIHS